MLPINKNTAPTHKRILFLAPQPFYVERGSSFRSLSTVSTLADLGFKIDVACFAGGEEIGVPGVRIYRTPRLPFLRSVPVGLSPAKVIHNFLLIFLAARHLITRRYSAIHCVEDSLFSGALLSLIFRTPYIIDTYSDVENHLQRLACGSIFKRLIARCLLTSLAGASGVIYNYSRQIQFGKHQHICDISGLPLTLYRKPLASQLAETGEKFQLTRRRVILYTGAFSSNDGVELLLRSFAGILKPGGLSAKERAGVCLVLAGGAIERKQLSRYRKLALHLGIEHQVLFTCRSAGEHFSSLVSIADIVVCPKLEGDEPSIKLYSYLSAGKPVVATSIPSHTRIVDTHCAYLAEPTIQSFSEIMSKALSLEPENLKRREEVLDRVSKKTQEIFSAGVFRNRLSNLYSHILSSGTKSPILLENPSRVWKIAGQSLRAVRLKGAHQISSISGFFRHLGCLFVSTANLIEQELSILIFYGSEFIPTCL